MRAARSVSLCPSTLIVRLPWPVCLQREREAPRRGRSGAFGCWDHRMAGCRRSQGPRGEEVTGTRILDRPAPPSCWVRSGKRGVAGDTRKATRVSQSTTLLPPEGISTRPVYSSRANAGPGSRRCPWLCAAAGRAVGPLLVPAWVGPVPVRARVLDGTGSWSNGASDEVRVV
ncbi:hypothetical protein F4802DRAFT_485491 [Xylaria palmicola]|nr:hypothetical protein F4802DRAFT_485491 [Xylaria palmicola]